MYPNMSDRTRFKLMRPMIIVCAILAFIPAMTVPIVFPVFLWAFSFGIPVFMMFFVGMGWKASKSAAWITILVTYLINFIWTFWTPSWASGPWALNMYPVTVSTIVLGIVLTVVLPGKPGLLKRHRAGLA
jgi:SSS family solute:Na+ symporter